MSAGAEHIWSSWLRWQHRQESKADLEMARRRLDQVLETYTDVTRFPGPRRPDAAVIVGACNDAYVSQKSVRELAQHWPGSQVRWVPGGHVSAFLLQQPAFRKAILDSLEQLANPVEDRAEAQSAAKAA